MIFYSMICSILCVNIHNLIIKQPCTIIINFPYIFFTWCTKTHNKGSKFRCFPVQIFNNTLNFFLSCLVGNDHAITSHIVGSKKWGIFHAHSFSVNRNVRKSLILIVVIAFLYGPCLMSAYPCIPPSSKISKHLSIRQLRNVCLIINALIIRINQTFTIHLVYKLCNLKTLISIQPMSELTCLLI